MKPFLFSGLLAAAVAAALWMRSDFGAVPGEGAVLENLQARPALPAIQGLDAARGESAAGTPAPAPPDQHSLSGWRDRLSELRAALPDATEAHEQLAAEIDHQYHAWLQGEIRALADLAPRDRHDRLADLEQSVVEGAAAIVDHLSIPGAPPALVLADSLEVLAAEIQYAEMAPTPEARLALLRLDDERQARLTAWATTGATDAAGPEAPSEVEAWYDREMAAIVALTPENAHTPGDGLAAVAR
jgi:hypothetical protein